MGDHRHDQHPSNAAAPDRPQAWCRAIPVAGAMSVLLPDSPSLPNPATSASGETRQLHADISSGLKRRSASTLVTYFRLQGGSWWSWTLIFLLQNGRYCPVYVLPLLTAHLIDRVDHQHPWSVVHQLPWALGATLALCVLTVFCNSYGSMLRSRIGRTLTANLRSALMRHINQLDFTFHDRSDTGMLQNKFTLDMTRLEGFEAFIAESLFMYGTVVLVMMAIVASTNLLLFAVLMVSVPANVLMVRAFWGRINTLNEDYRKAESGFIATLAESLSGLRMTRAHAVERFVEERVSRAAGDVAEKAIRLDLMSNLFGSGSWAVATFLNMALVGCGVVLVSMDGKGIDVLGRHLQVPALTFGEFTLLLSYYATISGSIGAILGALPSVAAAGNAIRSLSELYDEQTEAGPNDVKIEDVKGHIVFTGVGFDYPGSEKHCLSSLDIDLEVGKSLALVGPSGGGKSTVASLMLGFYCPTRGSITIDGRELSTIDRRSLRRHVGVVTQDVVLFHDTIAVNVAWGDRRPDLGKVREALRRAQALDFVEELAGGIGHVLGDHGSGLSGGQRQRLAIARALYRDPRLLILDEATSALDNESERLVQLALEEVKRDRTTLIIAHRLSTIRSADRIIVLAGGKAVESGTYDELMGRGGAFSQLISGQAEAPAAAPG
jgi:ATP-binding cassette subfamily B protein